MPIDCEKKPIPDPHYDYGANCYFLQRSICLDEPECTPCPKISGPLLQTRLIRLCSLWISTKYRTLHYLNITYGHARYDVRILLCVFSVASL